MIKAQDAIRAARSLLGTPYSQMDCIGLIRAVIQRSPGGVPVYRCEGTNWLWDSIENNGKYRHLTWRQESLAGAKAGMLAFKRYGPGEEDHVGLVTDDGTVIHSSSVKGRVVETPLTAAEGWDLLARHRYIAVAGDLQELDEDKGDESMTTLYKALVTTNKDPLRVRDAPETGRIIGHAPKGRTVDVLTDGDWPRIRYGELVGYASADYLTRVSVVDDGVEDSGWMSGDPDDEQTVEDTAFTTLVDDNEVKITLVGKWRVAND